MHTTSSRGEIQTPTGLLCLLTVTWPWLDNRCLGDCFSLVNTQLRSYNFCSFCARLFLWVLRDSVCKAPLLAHLYTYTLNWARKLPRPIPMQIMKTKKNKLNRRMSMPLLKLWSTCTNILDSKSKAVIHWTGGCFACFLAQSLHVSAPLDSVQRVQPTANIFYLKMEVLGTCCVSLLSKTVEENGKRHIFSLDLNFPSVSSQDVLHAHFRENKKKKHQCSCSFCVWLFAGRYLILCTP